MEIKNPYWNEKYWIFYVIPDDAMDAWNASDEMHSGMDLWSVPLCSVYSIDLNNPL